MNKQIKIIKIINEQIRKFNLSLDDISKYTDIDKKILSQILEGKKRLKGPTLVSLCYLLQIDLKNINEVI